jgi:hypothetical protein
MGELKNLLLLERHSESHTSFSHFRITASMASGILRVGATMEFRLIVWDDEELGRGDFEDAAKSIDAPAGRILILAMWWLGK